MKYVVFKLLLIVIFFFSFSEFVLSQNENNKTVLPEIESVENLSIIPLQESESYPNECEIGEEILSNGFVRRNVIVKRSVTKDELKELTQQGKIYTLDETGEFILEETSIDMLPENWIFSADGISKMQKIDSYGNPIVNEVDGLPSFAQRDVSILTNDLSEIYRYYRNFQFAINGQTNMITVLSGDVFNMDSYSTNELSHLSGYLMEYEAQLANLLSQVIIRKIDFTDIVDLDKSNVSLVEKLSVELNNYEKEKYTQSKFKSFGDYEYIKTVYSEEILAFFDTFRIDLKKQINDTYLSNISTTVDVNTKATPSGLYYRGAGSYSSLSSGTNLCAGGSSTTYDDNTYSVPMPFSFEYYECQNSTNVSTIYVSTNGGINVSANSFYYNRSTLPQSGYNSYICPACDDWSCFGKTTTGGNANDKVFYNVQGAVGSRVMSVNWYSITNYGTSYPEDTYAYFSVKIYETDNSIDVGINYFYRKGEEISYINGIENRTGTDADCGESCSLIYPADNTSTYKSDYRYYPNIPNSVSISVSNSNICNGSSTRLTANTPVEYCSGGSYQYQFETTTGTVVRSWSTTNYYDAYPTSNTSYVVKARCSLTTCKVVTSSSISVNVQQPPTAPTSISGTTNICTGSSTALTALGGSNGSGATYQWYAGGCGSGSVLGTGSSITVSPTSTTTYYVRRVGTTNCTNTTSCASVTVSVDAASNAGTMSITNSQMCSGGSTSFSVSGTTGFQQMQYQWNGTGGTWTNWGTSNPHAWSSTSAGSTLYVRSWADNGACSSVYSSPVSVGILADPVAPTITRTPNTSPVCQGTSLDITAAGGSGGCGTITNQYRYNNGSWSTWSSSAPAFSATPGTNYYESRRIATGSGCDISSSNQVSWAVDATSNAGTVTQNPASGGTVCAGNNVTYTQSGGTGTFNYFQYQWNGISGAWSSSWSTSNPHTWGAGLNGASELYVRAIVTNGACPAAVSSPVNITVLSTANNPGAVSVPTSICQGTATNISNVTAATTGTPASSGPTYYYYWKRTSAPATGYTNYASSSASSYALPAAVVNTPGTYLIARNSAFACTGQANNATTVNIPMTVTPNASIASVTGSSPLCIGATNGYSANSVVLGGGSGAWSSSNTSVATVNSSGVVTPVGSGTCNITYTITGGCNGTPSASKSLTITPNASIASVTGMSPLCIGSTNGYSANSVVLGGGSGAWSSSNTSVATVNSSGVVTAVGVGTCNITYTIIGGCNGTPSASKSLTVAPNASIASVTGSSPLCIGATNGYSANSVVLGGGSGAWSSSNTSVATVNSSGVVTAVGSGTCNIIYTITGGCNGTPSVSKSLTIIPSASIASVTGMSPICIGSTNGYSVNSVVLGGGSGAWSSSNTSVATVNSSGVVTAVGSGTCNIIYTITGGCNGTPSASKSLTITPNASIASVTGMSPLCIGSTNGYSANSVVLGGGSGAWSSSNTSVATVNSSGVVTAVGVGTCNIIYTITGGCNGTPSASKSLTITPNASIASVTGMSPLCIGSTNGYSANSVVLGGGSGAWSSSNTSVATVNSSGVVTAVGSGTCNIIYTITGGCNGTPSASKSLTITPNASIASVTGTSPLCIGSTNGYSANSVVLGGGSGAWSSSNTSVATVNSSGVVTAVGSGTCNIIYTITGGCNGTPSASKSLTITPNASIASVTGMSPICIGSTNGYSVNSVVLGGGSGAWSSSNTSVATVNSSGVVTAVGSGTCNIIYTITGGCNGTPSASKSLTITPNASIASVTGMSPLCIGSTNGYSANSVVLGGGSGAWSSSNTSVATVNSSGVVTAVGVGTCNITYTITGGCNGTPSASKSLTVNPNLPVSVSISASENPTCSGVSGTFTATPNNGGIPSYQWKLNGANIGSNSNTYVNSGLLNSDQIVCVLTSTATCVTGNPASSNTITMTVTTPVTTGLANGDYVWSGNISTDWETASNWLIYDGSNYLTATVMPDNTKNVFLRAYAPCASNASITTASSAVSCHDLNVETGLTLGNISQIDVSGDFINSGTFIAGSGTVSFNGTDLQKINSGGDDFNNVTFNNSFGNNADIEITTPMIINGGGDFYNGIVYYSGTGSLLFSATGTTNGGSNTSFVNGVVSRVGSGSFTMPVGDISTRSLGAGNIEYSVWGPIDVNPVASTTTSVEYFFTNTGMPDWWEHGGNMDATIDHVSDREFWSITSTENFVNTTLYWNDNTHANGNVCVHSLCDGDNVYTASDLTVAYWSSSIWRDAGGTAVGNHDDGSITSGLQIPFGAKSTRIITFASKDDLNPLPVELIKFYASCEGNSAIVEWLTASETNNEMFILEKSNDMKNFFEVVRIPGAGSSNIEQSYSFTDKELFDGDNYYRLLQVDFDGRTTIINPISINCSKEVLNSEMIIYPNPFNDKVNIVIEGLRDNDFAIEVYNHLGSLVFVKEYSTSESEFHAVIDLSNLKPAVYSVRLTSKNHIFNKKVVKK